MLNIGNNLFELAAKQLKKEKKPITLSNVIDYAIEIRKYLDKYSKKSLVSKKRAKQCNIDRVNKEGDLRAA